MKTDCSLAEQKDRPSFLRFWCAGVDEISAVLDTGYGGELGNRVPSDYLNDLAEIAHDHNETVEFAREALEACKEAFDDSVNASPYPDGPCLPRETREMLQAVIKKAQL